MFKLVVLCAVVAAAAAEPGALFATPLVSPLTYSAVVAPATTTISQQASSVVHPSPYHALYSPYYAHFLKKRSAPLFAAPYLAPRLAAPALYTPLLQRAAVLPAPLLYSPHYIKKRSAPLLATTYVAPALSYTAPALAYAAPPARPLLHAAPLLPAAPVVHAPIAFPHLIKKRSAPLLASTYIAPASYSHQSRVDVQHSAPLITSYATSFAYASPIAYSHLY